MKSTLHFFCFLFALCLAFFQSAAQQLAAETMKNNVFYIGRDNPLTIVVTGFSCKDIVVKTDNGKIERTGDCEYNAVPQRAHSTVRKIETWFVFECHVGAQYYIAAGNR
jgi:hypothetical protein